MNAIFPSEPVRQRLAHAPAGALIYLVGVGGCGMSGLGHLLLDAGFRVAGSDLVVNDEIEQLRRRGAILWQGHAAGQFLASAPWMAAYSSAVSPNNPELRMAAEQGVPAVRRAVLLAALLHQRRGICVAGMHGKTTTTALITFGLEQLGARPSFAVGALVPQLEPHARWVPVLDPADQPVDLDWGDAAGSRLRGSPGWFVIEADESDGTLREFHPEHGVVLNLDEEHLDFYKDMDEVCRTFQQFAEQIRGLIVYCADDVRLRTLFGGRSRTVTFGYSPEADYQIVPLARAGLATFGAASARPGLRFEIVQKGVRLGEYTLALVGEKNASNAAAAIALLHQLGYEPGAIASALAAFRGAARRQQVLFSDAHYRVVEDYGHHPREISATLQALKDLGGRRLLVAFQPHRFTRTQQLLPQFATCFHQADRLWITEVYAASEAPIPGVNGACMADAVQAQGQPVEYQPTLEGLRTSVRSALEPGDLVLFLGAGDITQAAHQFASDLEISTGHSQTIQPAMTSGMPLSGGPAGPGRAVRRALVWDELADLLAPETVWRQNEPLARHTTWRVGGPADFWVEPSSETDLARVVRFCAERQLPFLIIGQGSNLLVRDAGFRGAVIRLSQPAFARLKVSRERIEGGAGVSLRALTLAAERQGAGGFEFLEGIPGSLGGALRMNAGAMGSTLFDRVERVWVLDRAGQVMACSAGELAAGYRQSPWLATHIALKAELRGTPAAPAQIAATLEAYRQQRRQSQPAGASAGCVFKNPEPIAAGRLIEELGFKGSRIGGAVVSTVHANFILNEGGATAGDILALMAQISQRARAERGIELEPEVVLVGEET